MSPLIVQASRGFVISYIAIVLLPICCHWIYQLYKHKDELFLQKRNIKMTFAMNVSLLLYMLFSITFFMEIMLSSEWELTRFSIIAMFLSMVSFAFCLMLKSWIIYYDYQYITMTLSLEWSSVINSSSNSNNWFLRNRTTYGNLDWLGIRSFPLLIIQGALTYMSFVQMFSGNHVTAAIGLCIFIISWSLPLAIYITILCKTPSLQKFSDLFFIHWELKLIAKLLSILLVVVGALFAIGIVFFMVFPSFMPWYTTANGIIMPSYMALIIYASTKLVINKNSPSFFQPLPDSQSVLSNTERSASGSMPYSGLKAILAKTEAIHLFMLHLTKEYSMEILLSFIEFSQYLDYLESVANEQKVECKRDERSKVILASSLPLSSIVVNKAEDHDFKRKGYELYCKYISISSEYEINIRSKLRSEFTMLMAHYQVFGELNVTIVEMYQLFLECRNEMFLLLGYAHDRFTKSDDYRKIVAIISDEEPQ